MCLLEVVVCTQLVVSGDVCVQLLVWWCVFIGNGSVVVCTQLVVSGDACVQLLVWWCVFIGSGSVVVCTQLVMCVCNC